MNIFEGKAKVDWEGSRGDVFETNAELIQRKQNQPFLGGESGALKRGKKNLS